MFITKALKKIRQKAKEVRRAAKQRTFGSTTFGTATRNIEQANSERLKYSEDYRNQVTAGTSNHEASLAAKLNEQNPSSNANSIFSGANKTRVMGIDIPSPILWIGGLVITVLIIIGIKKS